jgi:integrase
MTAASRPDEENPTKKTRRGKRRANGEGSIFPYRNGYAAYVWITTPEGEPKKKWIYGKSREDVHSEFVKLQAKAQEGPVATSIPTLDHYLTYWLREIVVEPDFAPLTIATYEGHVRNHIRPALGKKRLDKITVRDLRGWLNALRKTCQCCVQGKDAQRPKSKQRCCAVGKCCEGALSERSCQDVLGVLRSAFSYALTDEHIIKNPATALRIRKPRKKRVKPWSVEEARLFLEAARTAGDPLYTAYVLILVLGLRKGEVLGLTWDLVDLDAGEIWVGEQLQRVRHQLLRRQVKTEASQNGLPLPEICLAALRLRKEQQNRDRKSCGDRWQATGLVITTRKGTPIEPRNFNRSFDTRIEAAKVRRITVHGTRGTCATLLAALDVHPRVAMRILRHSRIAVTMEIYTEATDEATREALKKLGNTLGSSSRDA